MFSLLPPLLLLLRLSACFDIYVFINKKLLLSLLKTNYMSVCVLLFKNKMTSLQISICLFVCLFLLLLLLVCLFYVIAIVFQFDVV